MIHTKWFKRIGCVLLAAMLSVQPISYGLTENIIYAEAAEQVTVEFEQDFAQIDVPLSVVVSGAEATDQYTYRWYLDDVRSSTTASEYTPSEKDFQKEIRVEVYSKDGNTLIGSAEMFFSQLPVVYINTKNSVEITSKENYVDADMKIQGNSVYGKEDGLYDGLTEIRGRGNATWSNPKKPYKLKLDSSTDLFGMGKSKHWVLLANYVDHSLIRNKISYDFSGALGMPYMQSVYVDVILNGKYLGCYQLCEQVKLEKDRVNIQGVEDKVKEAAKTISRAIGVDKDDLEDMMNEDLSWITTDKITFDGTDYKVSDYYPLIDITGGYLLELDYYDDEVSQILTNSRKRVKFKNPEYAVTNDEMYGYVEDYLNAFEAAVMSNDFHADYEGNSVHYSDLFDMESLVQFWIVQEVFFNWDGMNNSNYIYKEVGEKMKFGPIWDMDLTAGSNSGTASTTTWQTFGFEHWQHPDQWYRYITKDPYFIVQAYYYYHSIRDTLLEELPGKIEALGKEIEVSGNANKSMWHGSDNYMSSVNSYKEWMKKHLEWMDEQFVSPEKMIESLGQYSFYGYQPSSKIKITADTSGAMVKVTVEANGINQITYSVNGKSAGSAVITGGRAEFEIEEAVLNDDGTPNTIQVFDAESKGVSNYAVFEKEIEAVPESFSGTVTISGIERVNATLKFSTEGLNDEVASIQWMADEEVIEGATGDFYRVTSDVAGKKISVVLRGAEKEGELVSEKTAAIAAPEAQKTHLIINQVFGGGGAGGVSISHGYIEIYNPTDGDVDLSEYQIGYLSNRSSSKAGSTSGEMKKLSLSGILPAKTGYLIRCAEEASGEGLVLTIGTYDQEWDQTIDNKQYQVSLYCGEQLVDGVAVNEESLEGKALVDPLGDEIISKNKCIRRISYVDTDDNAADFEVLNLTKIPENIIEQIRPRATAEYETEKPVDPTEPSKPTDTSGSAKPSENVRASLNVSTLPLQKKQKAKVLKLKKSSVAGDKIVKWTSSNQKVVSVDSKTGRLVGKKVGKAVITAHLKSGGTATCTVTVKSKAVATKKLTLSAQKVKLKVGERYQIKIKTRVPLTANDKITYKSNNTSIAKVSKKGKLTAKRKGSCLITVKAGSGKTKKIRVTVK